MANQKNKKAKKPAVGNPAAGSNNKRDKKQSQKAKKPVKKGNSKTNKDSNSPALKKENNSKKKISFSDIKKALIEFKEKYNLFKIAVVFAMFVTVITGIILLQCNRVSVPDYVKNSEYKGRTENESVAFRMDVSENQQEALSRATKVKGDKGAFDFFINDSIVMDEYDDPALIEFGNVCSNDCILVFYLLDENGNELYRSLGVEPGKQIRSVEFFDEIPYGTHDVTVAVLGYDAETYENIGLQTAQIKLEIGVE